LSLDSREPVARAGILVFTSTGCACRTLPFGVCKALRDGILGKHFEESGMWCLAFAERATAGQDGAGRRSGLRLVAAEHDNIRTALDSCALDPKASELQLRLAAAMGKFWFPSHHAEARPRLAAARAQRLWGANETWHAARGAAGRRWFPNLRDPLRRGLVPVPPLPVDPALVAEREAGRMMNLDHAVAYALQSVGVS
jgi:hypothetical protein